MRLPCTRRVCDRRVTQFCSAWPTKLVEGFFLARSAKDLQGVFAEIEQEMRTQYYVSFPPRQAAPGFHALQVEVVRAPQKLQVHARHGYYAAVQ